MRKTVVCGLARFSILLAKSGSFLFLVVQLLFFASAYGMEAGEKSGCSKEEWLGMVEWNAPCIEGNHNSKVDRNTQSPWRDRKKSPNVGRKRKPLEELASPELSSEGESCLESASKEGNFLVKRQKMVPRELDAFEGLHLNEHPGKQAMDVAEKNPAKLRKAALNAFYTAAHSSSVDMDLQNLYLRRSARIQLKTSDELVYSPSGKYFAKIFRHSSTPFGGNDQPGRVEFFNLDGSPCGSFDSKDKQLFGVAFDPHNEYAVLVTENAEEEDKEDGSVQLLRYEFLRKEITHFTVVDGYRFQSLTISQNGQYIALSFAENSVVLDSQLSKLVDFEDEFRTDLCLQTNSFGRDSKMVEFSSHSGSARTALVDLASKQYWEIFGPYSSRDGSFDSETSGEKNWSFDNRYLAIGYESGEVVIFDTQVKKTVAVFSYPINAPTEGCSDPSSGGFAWLPDNRMVTYGADGRLRIWSLDPVYACGECCQEDTSSRENLANMGADEYSQWWLRSRGRLLYNPALELDLGRIRGIATSHHSPFVWVETGDEGEEELAMYDSTGNCIQTFDERLDSYNAQFLVTADTNEAGTVIRLRFFDGRTLNVIKYPGMFAQVYAINESNVEQSALFVNVSPLKNDGCTQVGPGKLLSPYGNHLDIYRFDSVEPMNKVQAKELREKLDCLPADLQREIYKSCLTRANYTPDLNKSTQTLAVNRVKIREDGKQLWEDPRFIGRSIYFGGDEIVCLGNKIAIDPESVPKDGVLFGESKLLVTHISGYKIYDIRTGEVEAECEFPEEIFVCSSQNQEGTVILTTDDGCVYRLTVNADNGANTYGLECIAQLPAGEQQPESGYSIAKVKLLKDSLLVLFSDTATLVAYNRSNMQDKRELFANVASFDAVWADHVGMVIATCSYPKDSSQSMEPESGGLPESGYSVSLHVLNGERTATYPLVVHKKIPEEMVRDLWLSDMKIEKESYIQALDGKKSTLIIDENEGNSVILPRVVATVSVLTEDGRVSLIQARCGDYAGVNEPF